MLMDTVAENQESAEESLCPTQAVAMDINVASH
jgi:hypothetical protein